MRKHDVRIVLTDEMSLCLTSDMFEGLTEAEAEELLDVLVDRAEEWYDAHLSECMNDDFDGEEY